MMCSNERQSNSLTDLRRLGATIRKRFALNIGAAKAATILAVALACLLCAEGFAMAQQRPDGLRELNPRSDEFKNALSKAASITKDETQRFKDQKPVGLRDFRSKSLTLILLSLETQEEPPAEIKAEFQIPLVPMQIDSAKVIGSMLCHDGSCSILKPGNVVEVQVDLQHGEASGTVKFENGRLYGGRVAFRAVQLNGQWVIYQFSMPARGITTTLCADGNWRLTTDKLPAN